MTWEHWIMMNGFVSGEYSTHLMILVMIMMIMMAMMMAVQIGFVFGEPSTRVSG